MPTSKGREGKGMGKGKQGMGRGKGGRGGEGEKRKGGPPSRIGKVQRWQP